jgi:hypothetical protein
MNVGVLRRAEPAHEVVATRKTKARVA